MAMSKYTGGGGFSNYTSYTSTMPISYYVPPTPRYDNNLDARHARMSQWSEERRRRKEAQYDLTAVGGAVGAFDENAVKRRKEKEKKKKGRTVNRRALEEGAEQNRQLEEEVTVQCGADATLPCRTPRPVSVAGVEWTRTDLDQYVYLHKDGEPDLTEQHQDYRGRCELKGGTGTLLLKNVTSADSGLYECRFVIHSVSKRVIIHNDPVSVVRLWVMPTGACAEEEDEEEEEEEKDDQKKIKPPPQGTTRHHYIAAGVVGLYGLMVGLVTVVLLAL